MNKKVTTKKTVSKSSLVKPKVIYKNNLTNILLIILICLTLVLVILTTVNLVSKSNYLKDEIIKETNITDANFNVTIEEPLNYFEINLNEVSLKESELVNEIVVLEENIDSLKSTYGFAFNDSLIDAYGFFPTVIGDVILEYMDYIIVYNVENEKIKSIWNIEYIDK